MSFEPVTLSEKRVGPGAPAFIIAEAGVNHNGDTGMALQLVELAASAGVDAVKFQSFKAELVVNGAAPKARYQSKTTNPAESQMEMLKRLELSPGAMRDLQAYSEERGLLFMSTPFDERSADLLDELGVSAFKISSGEITNWPFLRYIASKRKPIILSTGMAYLSEVEAAVRVINQEGCRQLILLHCVSDYPANPAEINLRAMDTMSSIFRVPVGFSDHTLGIEISLAAAALGACVVEKHFTLDRNLPGPDHSSSLNPEELRALVKGIRKVEAAMGDGDKQPSRSERENREVVRRSLAAAVDIPEGTILEGGMLQALRPAKGISPALVEQVNGRRLRRTLQAGAMIAWSDLE